MAWRWINRAASFILALIVVALLAGAYLFYRAMPAYSGAEKLPGLSAHVRIWRDHFGVPHLLDAGGSDLGGGIKRSALTQVHRLGFGDISANVMK